MPFRNFAWSIAWPNTGPAGCWGAGTTCSFRLPLLKKKTLRSSETPADKRRFMLMMKRISMLAVLGIGFTVGARAAITVSLGTLAPEGTTYHRTLLELREAWRKAPGGGVNLRI